MKWSIAEARRQFSKIIGEARREPQEVFNRDRKVAVVVSAEEFRDFEAWRRTRHAPSLSARFEELRRLCAEENYRLAAPKRRDRANAFRKVLDELPG